MEDVIYKGVTAWKAWLLAEVRDQQMSFAVLSFTERTSHFLSLSKQSHTVGTKALACITEPSGL